MSKKKTTLPNNVNEEEFLTVLENISKRLAYKFNFGYHSIEDMKQQAAIFALEGLKKYDNSRPLENGPTLETASSTTNATTTKGPTNLVSAAHYMTLTAKKVLVVAQTMLTRMIVNSTTAGLIETLLRRILCI